jgi:hypothetical protein
MPKESTSVESILGGNEIDSSTYRVGPSQVSFFVTFLVTVGIISHLTILRKNNASQLSIFK